MRIGVISSDSGGCFHFRVKQPLDNLKAFGVQWINYGFMPSNPLTSDLDELCKLFNRVDIVICQRSTNLALVRHLKNACHLMGKPLVYEVDDDYINLFPTNPAYYSLCKPEFQDTYFTLKKQITEAKDNNEIKEKKLALDAFMPILEKSRQEGIEQYKDLLKLPDLITVTTKELKSVLYLYNENIAVLPNNVENVYYEKDYVEEKVSSDGNVVVPYKFGLAAIPAFWSDNKGNKKRIIRVGYTGTISHREEFGTISYYWNKLVKKYADQVWFVYLGDNYFYEQQNFVRNRRFYIPQTQFDTYLMNVRNIDVGIAPLMPNIFNQSKSDIKMVEYGCWGNTAVLPNYVTYNRNWKHEETCLFYNNGYEFEQMMEEIIFNQELRITLGQNAREYVRENRLERLHSEERFNVYNDLISSHPKLVQFTPNKELVNA